VYIDQVRDDHIGLPNSIIPSLSIVVGLMLVFRNQTSYDRFWQVCRSLYVLGPFCWC
jgi:putative membrane protein